MDTKTFTGIFCGLAGLPRQKRWIFAYMALCFLVYGALEYFGVIRLESL